MSASTIEWLEHMGVQFEGAYRYFPKSEMTWHIVKTGRKTGPSAAAVMTEKLREYAESRGVKFMFCTPAKEIEMKDGTVTGVTAESSREEITVEAKAVIICTGGAGADKRGDRSGFREGPFQLCDRRNHRRRT
jgi:fumarate reductase flavoprotein subunit